VTSLPSLASIKKTFALRWPRLIPLFLGAALLVAAKVALTGHLLINYTPSIPRGIYWISPGVQPQRGDLVAVPTPESVRALVYERGYVPRSIELLAKPVVAVGGDDVCVREHELIVNGQMAGTVLDVDRAGQPMPRYLGCDVLAPTQVFLATSNDHSFDSRYFGPVEIKTIRGTLAPLLTFSD
jgi:conjugative transfer signal peptidase TraF